MKKILSFILIFSCLGLVVTPIDARRSRGKKISKKLSKSATKNRLGSYKTKMDIEAPITGEAESYDLAGDLAGAANDMMMSNNTEEAVYHRKDDPRAEVSEYFNPAAKRKEVIALVEKGVEYLKNNSADQAFSVFSHSKDFVYGELYLFVFDIEGVCMAHGQQANVIWTNMIDSVDKYGTPIVRSILEEAQRPKRGGWVTYSWRDATKVSYVREVIKDGKSYAVGSGYYPHSKPDAVVNLVRGAVGFFKGGKEKGRTTDDIFSTFSYPLGQFIVGDLYLYALDFEGNIVAQGDRPGLIGQNSIGYRDSTGKYVNKEIIEGLKTTKRGEGVWVEYQSKNTIKKAYAERVTDTDGKDYFIACGYYPKADRREVQNLVRRGYQFMKKSGKSQASRAFSDKRGGEYLYGDLFLFVYDFKGKCIAHGGNPDFVGQNQFNLKDEDGTAYVQEVIEKAQDGGGWLDFKLRNSFFSVYVEPIDLGIDKFVIGSGLYPISKRETMLLLVKSGAGYLRTEGPKKAFSEFVKLGSPFIRGDLNLFAFHPTGICFAYGDRYDLIWRNLINVKDDNGQPFVKVFINTVKQGPGDVTFTLNGATNTSYVEAVEVEGKQFIVGSGFYK